jgi:thioredoxin 1
MSKLQTYTDANWEAEVMASNEPVLVDFWADWCQPCKVLVPTIEAVADQYQGRLKVGKVNVEENDAVAFRYSITTLPTLMLFKKGQVSEQRVGLITKDKLVQLIEPLLA